ncbi:low temperature requirement A [Rubellimicrobium mesophilum DSM 19309]|uniref:Low temperature requirement A n=1 Tax=Rubellimicrobium mesophilum DSM 19309 TaxID=442562 RepID=A0A017HK08_9RHOB|nr:low temperature requirement protein A [Rubellimicrobium mesophilum]EYD74089.1 low temperature requirement A [Rubellimicrobium mesophilum DSM 19309]
MAGQVPGRGYLRDRDDEDSAEVSFVELFFDLVFVFAVTQLAAYLGEHFTPEGLLRAWVLFLMLWWLWINTSWATNRLDHDRGVVRGIIFAMMAAGLMVSVSIPMAFESRGLAVAIAYVAMQLGRSLFMVWALRRHGEERQSRTFLRVALWFAISGALWIGGGLAEGDARVLLWALALVVDLVVPWLGFRLPGLGASSASEWDVEGEHLAERCGLFIILALGETLLVTGARMETLEWSAVTLAAFGVSLLGTLAMWWIYFDVGVHHGSKAIGRTDDPGRLARFAYTYVHLPIVAGIVGAAVGDKFLLAHPGEPATPKEALVILGGPALFLLGNYLFKNATSRRWPLSHVVGLALLGAATLALSMLTILGLAATAVVILVLVAILERILLRSRAAARSGVN